MFKEYRELRKITQDELTNITNLDKRTIQRVENEEQLPNLISFARLVKALNITDKDVLTYIDKISNLNNTKHNK